jgi:hypothetical protein
LNGNFSAKLEKSEEVPQLNGMRKGWKGIVSESGTAPERLSDRPGLTAPAFQSCLPQEVMKYAPDTEGGLVFRDHRSKAALDQVQGLALVREGAAATNCRFLLL